MKNIKYIFVILSGLLLTISGCQKDYYEMGALVAPTNLTVAYEIVGVDSENPHGDGSGLVNFTVSADNAITYNFDFGDGRGIQIASGGKLTYQFAVTGLVEYKYNVAAVGTGGVTSNKSDKIEVFSSFSDEEALEFLTGGSSKTWYWASDQLGHAGMGTQAEDYGNLDYTFASWWNIGPFDPDKACMYDAEFVFTKTETGGLNYEQVAGVAFIPATYAGKIGVDGDVCHGEDVATPLYGVKNVSFLPSSSRASVDGGYRGTSMSFSDDGFMCWWVGASEYDIIQVSENILHVRIKEDEVQAWYHIFTSEKPVPPMN
jgi:hypothetical protein